MPNYTYNDVADRWDKARAFGETRSLPEYAQHLNDIYETQDFSAGLRDGPWTHFSNRVLDPVLKGTVGQVTGPIGQAVGSIFGQGEAGQRVGEDLPRALLETAPLYLAGPEAGLPATAAALAGTGGLMAAHAYADTGSAKAALISGATGAALPGLGKLGGNLAAHLAGAEGVSGEWLPQYLREGMGETFGGLLPKTAADVGRVETSRFVGSQLAQFAGNEASMYAMHRTLSPNEPFDPLSADFLLQQIPFTVHDAISHVNAPHTIVDQIRPMLKQPDVAPPEPKPYVRPTQPEQEATLGEAMANVANVYADPKSTLEEQAAAMDAMVKANLAPNEIAATKAAVEATPASEETRTLQAHPSNVDQLGNGNYRVLADAYSHPDEAPEHNTFFVNGSEPKMVNGNVVFQDSVDKFVPATDPLPNRAPRPDPNQPELPTQQTPGALPGTIPSYQPQDLQGEPLQESPPEIREPEQQVMVQMGVEPQKVLQLVDSQTKANNLMLDSFQGPIHKDVNGNVVRLGNTSVAADGWMNETRFQKSTQLSSEFVEAMRQQYPEAFQDGRVNATALVKGLQERPMLEVKELGGAGDNATQERNRLRHELDTRFPGWEDNQPQIGEGAELLKQYNEAESQSEASASRTHYSFLGPKSEQDMPGYVEGLVRVPFSQVTGPRGGLVTTPLHFDGPHFGNEDKNVLAFYRGYEETVNGKKVFHVIEVQSDWAQKRAREDEEFGKGAKTGTPSHPLLPFYESLALKAALQHAQKVGAEGIMLSDAETAMMTEGHDRNVQGIGFPITEEQRQQALSQGAQIAHPTQDAGMRLHYDRTLPETLAKLTGENGVEVGVGQHKSTMAPDQGQMTRGQIEELTEREGPEILNAQGSPVFRDSTGAPKTQITGRLYSLDKIAKGLSADDTLSLKEAVAKHEQAQQKEAAVREQLKTPITDAKQIVSFLGDSVESSKAPIDSRISSGASAAQAVVHEVMRKLGMDVHEAKVDQAVQEEEVHRVANLGSHGQEANEYGPGIKNEQGQRMMFPSESKAQWYLENKYRQEHPEDKNQYETRSGGGKLGTPEFRGYYLAPKENIGESIDKTLPSGKETKQDYVSAYAHEQEDTTLLHESAAEELSSRPQPTQDLYHKNLNVAERSPKVFARASGFDESEVETAIKQARIILGFKMIDVDDINEELRKAGLPGFEDQSEKNEFMSKLKDGLEEFGHSPTLATLGSHIPFDPKLVEATGVKRGPTAVLQWIAAQNFGITSDVAKGFLKQPQILGNLTFVSPSRSDFNPAQTFYNPSLTGGEINLHYFPTAETVTKWAYDIVHETVHHFDDQLASRTDPAAMEYRQMRTDILQTLRESLAIPKKIRDYVKTIQSRGDYEKWATGEQDYRVLWKKDLGEKDFQKYEGILYGLQNEDEMVAQMASDKDMQAFMFRTKPPKAKGLWDSTIQWFSEIFGKYAGIEKNAFTEMITAYDNYLTGGILKNTYNGQNFIRDALVAKYGTMPEALASRMQSVEGMYSKGDLHSSIAGFTREMENGMLHPNQSQGPIVQNLRTALVSGKATEVFHETMNLLADEVPVHEELGYRMLQDYMLVKELHQMIKDGRVTGSVPENLVENLRKSRQKINAMKQGLEKQGLALERWNNLSSFEQGGYEKAVVAAATGRKFTRPQGESGLEDEARGAMGLDKEPEVWRVKRESSLRELEKGKLEKAGDWFRRVFMQTQYLKQQVPEARTVFDHVSQRQAEANANIYSLNVGYAHDPVTGKPSDERWQNNVRVANDPKLIRASSDLHLWMNVQEQNGESVSLDQPFAKGVLDKLSKPDRQAVIDEINSARSRNMVRANTIVPKFFSDINVEKTGYVITARESGMLPEQGRELARSMYDTLASLQNPDTQAQGIGQLQQLSTQMQPQTFQAALKLSQSLVASATKTLELMRSRPNYSNEQRTGQYHLRMTGPQGETHYSSADDTQTLNARRKALEAKGFKFNYAVNKADQTIPTGDIDQSMFSAMQERDAQAAVMVQQALADQPDILARVLPELQRANDYQASLQAAQPIPGAGPQRKFVAGREEINMVKNDHEFQIRFDNYLRHAMTRAQASVDMLDPAIQGNATVKQLVQDHVSNFLSPDNPTVRKFNEYTYYTKLAWNFGVNFLHGVQSLTTGMASVIAETGGVGDAFALTAGAQKAVAGNRVTGKWANPEHQWLIDHAVQEGVGTGIASWQEMYDPDTLSVQSMNKPMNPVGKGLNFLQQGARNWTSMFLKFNDQIGLIAGYDLARSRGMDQTEAYNFAVDVKNRGYYTGGKAQRSVGLWSIKTKAIPQLMSSLQTYTLGWFSQLTNNYINGFGKAPEGLTPTQRVGAKKAFLYQLGAQAVLAGALGLPGVGQGLALMKQATGEDVKGMAQQGLAHLFDEDEKGGGMLSTLAMHGATAAFTPVDTSGRHMPSFPFIGVSPYKGFDLSTLAPAPVSTVADLVQGLLAAAKGDTDTVAQKTLPHVLQGPYKLWQGEGDIRDKRGGLLYQLSPMEKFVVGLGMTPSKVARAQDTAEAVKRMSEGQEQLLGSLADDLAHVQRTQGVDASRQRLREIVQSNPGIDPVKLASEAVNRLVAQTVPAQPQRLVNPAMDLTGLTSQVGPQEGQRFQVRQVGRQAFGLPPDANPVHEIQAHLMDSILQSNPYLPTSTARAMVLGKRPTAHPYIDLSSPVSQ